MYKHHLERTLLQGAPEELFDRLVAAYYLYAKNIYNHPFASEERGRNRSWAVPEIRSFVVPEVIDNIRRIKMHGEGVHLDEEGRESMPVDSLPKDAASIARVMTAAYLKAAGFKNLGPDTIPGLAQTVRTATRPQKVRAQATTEQAKAGVT